MDITVNVENVDLNSIVGEHYTQVGEDDYARTPQTLGQAVAVEIAKKLEQERDGWQSLTQRIAAERATQVQEQVKAVVAAAIVAEVQPTNGYGQPTGTPTSLTDLIMEAVGKALHKRTDYDRRPTLLQKVIAEEVEKALKKELTDAIADEKAKVVAAVRAKAAELIATAVKEGIGR